MSASAPAIRGFYPDPSICQVGGTYYVVNSSFEYLPGLPIHASTDLQTWAPVGNALTRPSQIREHGGRASSSVYAPTIRHHAGRFWIVWTDANRLAEGCGQFIITADDAAGPWSDPVHVPGSIGIDPDLAWDEHGVCHLTWAAYTPDLHGIASAPVDPATGALLAPPTLLWQGTGGAHPEGPHLYRLGEWWYLLIAEGGTERGHSTTIARARSLDGPFEEAPNNPILTHRGTSHPVQNVGHADLVQLDGDRWAMVHLGVRPRGVSPSFHVNGRETFVVGVDWVDGWPVVDEARHPAAAVDHSFVETFEDSPLDGRWLGCGMFPDSFSSRETDGRRLSAGRGPGIPLLAARVRDQEWIAEARLRVHESKARLVLRVDQQHLCALTWDGTTISASLTVGPVTQQLGRLTLDTDTPLLRIQVRLPPTNPYWPADEVDLVSLVAVDDAGHQHELATFDGRYLSTEVAGRFTGRVVGVEALEGDVLVCDFTYRDASRPMAV